MIDPGLCGRCRHAKVVESDRSSRFHLCRRSRTDPRYPRYPRLPVRACQGFEEAVGSGADAPAEPPGRARGTPDAGEPEGT